MTYGVPAAKGNNDYFQKVPLEKLAAPDVTLTANGTALKNLEDIVSITAMPTGQFSANQVIDLGYGIDADNYSNYKNIDISGFLYVLENLKRRWHLSNFWYGTTKWSNLRQEFATKRDIAKEKGAKAVLYYNPNILVWLLDVTVALADVWH